MGVIFRVGPNSVLVAVLVVVAGGWVVGSARLLAESGVGASCTAVVLEIIAAPERDTNNNNDMAGKDVGFIFAIIPPRGLIKIVICLVWLRPNAMRFFLSNLDFFWLMEIYLCVREPMPHPSLIFKVNRSENFDQ